MKRFLPIFIIAFALVSCENEVDLPTVEKNPIVFGEVETRAAISSDDDMIDSGLGFGVFGYVSGVTGPLFNNVNVTWDRDEEVWTYGDPKYWIPSHIHHFFAYYPYSNATTADSGVSGVQALGDNSGFKLNFTTPETADFDLLSAYKEEDTGADNFDGSVSLHFDHEMVNLNLKIWRDGGKHQNDKIRVKEVALSNVTWSGTLTKTAGGSTSWTNTTRKPLLAGTVAAPETPIAAATKTSSGITPGPDPDAEPCTPFKNGLLLIPATISGVNAVSLSIVYELQLYGAKENTWSEYSHNITLPATTWKAGTMVTYNVLLSNIVDITFHYISTTVDPWGAPQLGGTIIIK